jgi:hypothetical protein
LVTNAIVKNELGNTLLNKIEPSIKSEPTPPKEISSHYSSASREYLADKSNIVNNQSEQAKKSYREKEPILKSLEDDKKGKISSFCSDFEVLPSNSNSNPNNISVNASVNSSINSLSRKSSYLPGNDSSQKPEEKRSSSITRSYDSKPEVSSCIIPSKWNKIIAKKQVEEEQKKNVSKSIPSSQLKENKPVIPIQQVTRQGPTKEEEEQYKTLLQEVKDLEQKKNNKGKKDESDDESFEEEEDKRVYAK